MPNFGFFQQLPKMQQIPPPQYAQMQKPQIAPRQEFRSRFDRLGDTMAGNAYGLGDTSALPYEQRAKLRKQVWGDTLNSFADIAATGRNGSDRFDDSRERMDQQQAVDQIGDPMFATLLRAAGPAAASAYLDDKRAGERPVKLSPGEKYVDPSSKKTLFEVPGAAPRVRTVILGDYALFVDEQGNEVKPRVHLPRPSTSTKGSGAPPPPGFSKRVP